MEDEEVKLRKMGKKEERKHWRLGREERRETRKEESMLGSEERIEDMTERKDGNEDRGRKLRKTGSKSRR